MSFLNKKIISFSDDNIIGLDVGSSAIKAVQMQGGIIRNYSFKNIPDGTIVNGNIVDEKKLISRIGDSVREAKFGKMKSKKVRFSISESKSFLRLISVPQMDQDELREAIKWEMEANIPLSVDQVYYDWKIVENVLPSKENKIRVLVLAAAKNVVEQMLTITESAGLEVVGVESEATALIRSLSNETIRDKTVLIVDLGRNKTTFVFAVKGVPCFTSSIPVSEQMIISQISRKFSISIEKAKKIEQRNGIGVFFEDKYLFSAIEFVLKNLVNEIERSVDFYVEGLKYSETVDNIFVCGRLAREKEIITYLSKKIGREIKVGDILSDLKTEKHIPMIKKDVALEYVTAIGLAMSGDE